MMLLNSTIRKFAVAALVAGTALVACGEPQTSSMRRADCVLQLRTGAPAHEIRAAVEAAIRADTCNLGDPSLYAEVLRVQASDIADPYVQLFADGDSGAPSEPGAVSRAEEDTSLRAIR
jgi:hypothetical protein